MQRSRLRGSKAQTAMNHTRHARVMISQLSTHPCNITSKTKYATKTERWSTPTHTHTPHEVLQQAFFKCYPTQQDPGEGYPRKASEIGERHRERDTDSEGKKRHKGRETTAGWQRHFNVTSSLHLKADSALHLLPNSILSAAFST